MCLSLFLCLSLSLFSLRLPTPPSLSHSLCCLALPVALFICDNGDSSSLILYFAPSLSLSQTLSLSDFLSLSLSLSLSETFSLSSSISLKLVLSLTLSLFVCRFLPISLCNYHFPWLVEMESTRHASTPLLATQPYLPRLACQGSLARETGTIFPHS